MKKCLFALIALVWLGFSAHAIEVESVGTVYIYEEAKEITIEVINTNERTQEFSIEYNAPTQFELSEANGTISGRGAKKVFLKIYPRSDLTGQSYQTKLDVLIGNERFVKKIDLVFREKQEEQEEGEKGEEGTQIIPVGLFGLGLEEMSWELGLNIALIIIAAILLVAFIARFVKRMEGR